MLEGRTIQIREKSLMPLSYLRWWMWCACRRQRFNLCPMGVVRGLEVGRLLYWGVVNVKKGGGADVFQLIFIGVCSPVVSN